MDNTSMYDQFFTNQNHPMCIYSRPPTANNGNPHVVALRLLHVCRSSKIHVFSLNVRPFLRPDFSNFFALTSQVEVDRFYLSPASPLVFSLLTQECCCPAGRPGVLPGLPCFHKRLFLDNMHYDPAGSPRVILHFLLSNKRLLVDDRCCNPAGRPPAIPHSPNEVWNPNEV